MTIGIRYASRERSTEILGRNHAGRRRHRLVRAEGARLGLAHAAAIESHATPAITDERVSVRRRRSEDHASSRCHERRRTEDHREASDGPTQGDREARHGEAQHREAQYREARHGETDHREAWRPQDNGSPQDGRALDGEAHDAPQLDDPEEAPLKEDRGSQRGRARRVASPLS
jgi:hypothetical protein